MNAKRKLDIDATRERLTALGLIHAAEQLEPLLSEAVKAETAPHAFVDQLLEAEYLGRETRRVRTALRLSSLPSGLTLADFDFAFQPAIERSRIDTLATCAYIRAAETVLIQGPPGVGKSHLAVGLGVKAVEHGFSAQFYRFDELKLALKGDAHLPPARLRRRKYLNAALSAKRAIAGSGRARPSSRATSCSLPRRSSTSWASSRSAPGSRAVLRQKRP